jgi:hypothetical protein
MPANNQSDALGLRYKFLGEDDGSQGRIPSLGVGGINLASLGSTASPNIPSLVDVAYDINKIGAKPAEPVWTPIGAKNPDYEDYAYKDKLGNVIGYNEAKYQEDRARYIAIMEVNSKNKILYDNALKAYPNILAEWEKATKGIYGNPRLNKPMSQGQRSGMMPGYSGISGINA